MKLQKNLEDEQRNQDAPELNSQLHGKGYWMSLLFISNKLAKVP